MNSRLIQIAALALVSVECVRAQQDDVVAIEAHDKIERSLQWFDGFRGSWFGLNRGLYKLTKGTEMETACMNDNARNHWVEAYSVWLGVDDLPDGIDMFTAAGDLLMVFSNLAEC